MDYCPLMSYQKQYVSEAECLGESCALAADGNGECLIKQALQIFVDKNKPKIIRDYNDEVF